MAFLGKAGSILRRTVSAHINQEITSSRPSIFQAIRCMSTSKIFVGGLSYETDDTSLREAFDKYGEVAEARVIVDRETGRSRGFGFITYSSTEEASAAIQALDQQDLHGRRIRVNYANERTRGGGFGGGGYGGGGGGYGGSGGGGYGGSGGGGYGGSGGGGYGSSGGGGYGGGGYGGGSNYNSGANSYGNEAGSFGGDSQNFGVAGGAGTSTGYEGETNHVGGAGEGISHEPLGGNYRDDADTYAERRG